jgi:hypothetical protein
MREHRVYRYYPAEDCSAGRGQVSLDEPREERGVLTLGSYTSKNTHLSVIAPFPCVVPAREKYQRSSPRHGHRARYTEGGVATALSAISKPARRVPVPHVALADLTRYNGRASRRGPDEPDSKRATGENKRFRAHNKRAGGSAVREGALDHEHRRHTQE